jgi:hypothetical protein
LYLVHICCKAIAGRERDRSTPKAPKHACLSCGNKIGMFRRLAEQRFCSHEHEQIYLIELQQLAIERLKSSLGDSPALNPTATETVHEDSEAQVGDCALVLAPQATGA